MKYKLINKPAILVTGKSIVTSQAESTSAGTVTAFWAKCNQDGTSDALVRLMRSGQIGDALLGVSYNLRDDGTFEYLIGAEVESVPQEPGWTTFEIPASQWMVFEAKGPIPDAIQTVWQYITLDTLPQSGYVHAGTPSIEVYYDGNTASEDYRCEVWVPVKAAA